MARLFAGIFLLLIATLLLAFFSVDRIDKTLYSRVNADFYPTVYQGIFDLLDDAIADRHGSDLQEALAYIRDRFKYPVYLHSNEDLNLPAKGWAILADGGIYLHDQVHSHNGYFSSIHRSSLLPDHIWSMPVDVNNHEHSVTVATGPLSLIRDRLEGKDASKRSSVMEQLQQSSGIPLALRTRAELEFSRSDTVRLNSRQVVVKNPGENGEQYWIAIDKGDLVFEAGPIYYPTIRSYVRVLLGVSFFAVMLTGCLLWVWPLWRDLRLLRRAASAIGEGKLETRVPTSQTSLIHSVLEGFNQMAIRTESMVASQRELTNAVSHELRTPLARMMFDLEMARHTGNAKDRVRHLDSLEFNVGELNMLVDELLTYAKQERLESPLELEALSAPEMHLWLNDQVDRAQRSHERSRTISIRTDVECEESLYFSTRLMAYAVSNVLQNAMRFAESQVEVQLQQQQNEWVMGIEDDGVGIPVAECERVFEPFSRLDESRQRNSGGFGLGLSIVRKIARWHQGDACIAACQSLSGTRVEIRWPASLDYA